MTEIKVKCPTCGDIFHTLGKVGEMEACTKCEDVFIIEDYDVVID